MKLKIATGILLVSSILISVFYINSRKNDGRGQQGNGEQKARRYLQPMMQMGESESNLISRFGPPEAQYETQTRELSASFFFPETGRSALAAGVGGVTAFFKSDQLTRWDPIYRIEHGIQ